MNLLLISNSTLHGSGYLDHCADEIKDFLGTERKKVAFVPYARPGGITHDEYTAKARERFQQMGYKLKSVHEVIDPVKLVLESEAIFIGGGNSFVLLHALQKSGIMPAIREKVSKGMPYIGTSAGSNVACPTIKTTNDMPIHEVENFNALDLVPFQINPHYLDPDPNSTHKGETRETRIMEFLEFNDKVVVGLREGCMVRINGDEKLLKGSTNARIFLRGKEPQEYMPVCKLDFLF
jgi:dipeptidase E